MKSIVATLSIVFVIASVGVNTASAGIVSKFLREATGGGAGRAAREGLESVAGKSVRQGARQGGRAIARVSDDLAAPIVAKFGDDGARAVASLSPVGAKRLATMSDELVAGGRAQEWLGLIAQHGDVAIEWLWERRRSVAVGTLATVALLQPEEFIKATESVATTTINAAGQHVARPIVGSAAAAFPWALLWLVVIGLASAWLIARKSLTAIFQSLLLALLKVAKDGPPPASPSQATEQSKSI